MTFVTLDNKDWCKGIYHKGHLHFSHLPENLNRTWKYVPSLHNQNITYAYIFANGKNLDEVCPENLNERWRMVKNKLKAFHNSFVEAKVDLEQNCFFDLVPQQFLLELCEMKCQIIDHCVNTMKKPDNYDLLLKTERIISEISEQNLNLDVSLLKEQMYDVRARNLLEKIKKTNKINYNLFGSKTGRLTTKKNTFPILNLDTKFRNIINPINDIFLELDYNSAEARVLFGLNGKDQPKEDIHIWNARRFSITREQAKKEFFSWLYGSKQVDSKKYENLFDLNNVLNKFYDGKRIKNPYGRKIECDDFHKLNYLIQSTTNDLVFEQMDKIHKSLKHKKSFISFVVHDSIVIDLDKQDRQLVSDLVDIFSNTRFGKFPVNVSVGKNYGSMRKLNAS